MNKEKKELTEQEKKEKRKAIVICLVFCTALIALAVVMNILAAGKK